MFAIIHQVRRAGRLIHLFDKQQNVLYTRAFTAAVLHCCKWLHLRMFKQLAGEHRKTDIAVQVSAGQ